MQWSVPRGCGGAVTFCWLSRDSLLPPQAASGKGEFLPQELCTGLFFLVQRQKGKAHS